MASHRASVSGATRTSTGDDPPAAEADDARPFPTSVAHASSSIIVAESSSATMGSTGRSDRASARSSSDRSRRARHSSQHRGGAAIAAMNPDAVASALRVMTKGTASGFRD